MLEKGDAVVPVEEFDHILTQVLDNYGLVLKARNDPHLPLCPFRDSTRAYCKYKKSLSEAKESEDYCRLRFQTCPTYQQHQLSSSEKKLIEEIVEQCSAYGVDSNKAERCLQRCFVTMELTPKKRRDYERVKESTSTSPLHPVRRRGADGRNAGGFAKSNASHDNQLD